MSELVLHHYSASPISEKVRKGFGLKGLAWRSVEHNLMPDRPELFALTGGYRRVPVLQVGADLYCDTRRILVEPERRCPTPTLFPERSAGISLAISRWTDGPMADLAARVALVHLVDQVPPDSSRIECVCTLDQTVIWRGRGASRPLARAAPRSIGWMEEALAAGDFIVAPAPAMADLLVWSVYWFLRRLYPRAEGFFAEFPALRRWAGRMAELGYGPSEPMSAIEALALAREATPAGARRSDPEDPQGLAPGMAVAIGPITDSGEREITGEVSWVNRDEIAIARHHERCGDVVVHFPRVGYRVRPLA